MADSGPSKLDLDVSKYVAGMEEVYKWTEKYASGMKLAAVSSLAFNSAGEQTDAVVELVAKSGEKLVATLKKISDGYEVASASIKKSLADITAEQQKALDEKRTKAIEKNLTAFRRGSGTALQKSVFPKGGEQTDYRSLFGDLNALESYIRRGEITAKRAKAILDDIAGGSSKRITKNPIQESFRLDALKLYQDASALQDKLDKRRKASIGATNAPKVSGLLDSLLGKLNPAATETQTRRVESSFIRLSKIVRDSGIDFTRFEELVRKSMTGVADPVSIAEKQIVAILNRLNSDFAAAKKNAEKALTREDNRKDALAVGDALKSRLTTGGLNERDLERVYAQIAKIQNLIARGPDSGGLSRAQFEKVWSSVTSGAKTSFLGAEETARQSIAKIRGIIQGGLNNPFEVNISFERSFNVLRSLVAANFALELLEKFKSLVDEAAEFQRAIALVQTITQDANLGFNDWADGIRRVSDELGKPIIEIAAAGYDLLSNQVTKAADTFDVLSTAGQFARITNSNTEDSVNLLSTAINTFRLNASDAQRVADQFFTVIDLGRVKAQCLANSGRTFEFGKTIGANIEDINASLITLTQSGIKEDTAMTLLNNVFQKLLNPTKELQALYDKLGVQTGENFIKTYGWVGALQKLKDETGGSSAKLADFFNEIRGYQGISNLTDRLDILTKSYIEFEHSAERAATAKDKFDKLPGQRYLEETNKVKNLFTTGIKTELLTDVLAISDAFGGLDKAITRIIQISGTLVTSLSTALAIDKLIGFKTALDEAGGAAAALSGALNGGIWTVGIAAAAAGVAYLTFKLIEAQEEARNLFDNIGEELESQNRKDLQKDAAARSQDVATFEKDLDKKKRALLDYAAVARQALNQQADKLDTAGSKLGENLKNSLELLLSSAKNSLQEIINKQAEALRSIQNLRQQKSGIAEDRNSLLFDYQKARLHTANNPPGLDERELYQQRIEQLQKEATKFAKTGNQQEALNAVKEIEKLTGELATKTVNVNGVDYLKYTGQEEAINDALKFRAKILDTIIAKRQQEAKVLEDQRKAESEKVKEAEDAAKSLHEFSLTDKKTGKQLYKTPEEVEKEYRSREQRLLAAVSKLKPTNLLETEDLLARRRQRVQEDSNKFFQNRLQRRGVGQKQDEVDNLQNYINKHFGEDAKNRIRETQKAVDESQRTFQGADRQVKQYIGSLEGSNNKADLGLTAINPEEAYDLLEKRAQILERIQQHVSNKDYGKAQDAVQELRNFQKQEGFENTQVSGPGGEFITAAEAATRLRARINQLQEAEQQFRTDTQAFEALKKGPEEAVPAILSLVGKYGDLSAVSKSTSAALQQDFKNTEAFVDDLTSHVDQAVKRMEALADSLRVARESALNPPSEQAPAANTTPPAKQWMGGPSGYFSDGGSLDDFWAGRFASGTDTKPVMVDPREFIMNAQSSQRFKSQLIAMNAGFDPGSRGAPGSTTNVGDIHVSVNGGDNSQQTIREIAAGINRELRRGTIKLGR